MSLRQEPGVEQPAPEPAPPEPVATTAEVSVERVAITQETPDLTGVMVVWVLSILAAVAIMAVTWWRRRA